MKHKTETKLFWVATFISPLLWGALAYIAAITDNPYWALGAVMLADVFVGCQAVLRIRYRRIGFWDRVDPTGVVIFGWMFAIGTIVLMFESIIQDQEATEIFLEKSGSLTMGIGFFFCWLFTIDNALTRSNHRGE